MRTAKIVWNTNFFNFSEQQVPLKQCSITSDVCGVMDLVKTLRCDSLFTVIFESVLFGVLHREYCGTTGLAYPTGPCDPGWYCVGGAEFAQPSSSLQGGQCQPGYYCPAGSARQLDCSPGQYCQDPELSTPSGNCSEGFYCWLGSNTPTPSDSSEGKLRQFFYHSMSSNTV